MPRHAIRTSFKPGYTYSACMRAKRREALLGKTGPGVRGYKTGISHKGDGRIVVLSPGHPRENQNHQVQRAYLVMEQKLRRYLKPGEVVHHADQDKTNDSPENLGLFNNLGEHKSFHAFLKRLNAE